MRKIFGIVFLPLLLLGCATSYPLDILKIGENNLQIRSLQTRQFDTLDEEKIITASAEALQDIGFTIDNSETKLGFMLAVKDVDATQGGQVVGAVFFDILSAAAGVSSNYYGQADAVQRIRASIIIKPSNDEKQTMVRITFQRLVWNKMGLLSRIESIKDEEMYQAFFEKLSKSVFLEEHKI